jgi:transcriptional regulator with XRE-family HTH domain
MAKNFFNVRLLIKLRLDRGLSPDKLAKLAGLSNGSIIRDMESGDTAKPRPDTVKKLSAFFKNSPEDFWSDKPEPFDDLAKAAEKIEDKPEENPVLPEVGGSPRELETLLALHRVSMEKYTQLASKMGDDAKGVIAESLRETRADIVSYLNRMADSNAKLAGVKVALELFCGLVRDNPELISEFGPRIDALMDFLTGKTTKLPKVSV